MDDNTENTNPEYATERNDQPVTGAAETTDAGTEGLETVSMAAGNTDSAVPDVPPVAEPQDSAKVAGDKDEEALPLEPEAGGLDRLLDITIGVVVVAAEATREAARQVRENGPEVAKNLGEKGRPIREKLAAQIKERGFGPSSLPLVDADGNEPADPANAVIATPDASTDSSLEPEEGAAPVTESVAAAPAVPVRPPITLTPGSSAADEISLLERRVRAMEEEVGPLDVTRLSGDPDGADDSKTPAESATYLPNELNEADAELEAVPQFIDSPYAVSETDDEQAREANPDQANGRDFDRPSPSDPFGDGQA